MDQKTVILGTAGHIDHGKTTLIKALTGIDTDRLKEEKARGITIELGFAHMDLSSGRRIGVIDVPGHERFVKNMVAGAMGVDLVALVIAADEGVMPQTREHLEICQLLGIKRGLVVLTKIDMVEDDWLEMVREDVIDFLKGTFLEGCPVVAVSSVTGQGLDEFLQTIDSMVAEIQPRAPSGPYRLPVDRVFTIKGFGTVVTGTSISGRLAVGDEVQIYPKGISARIRGIQVHGKDCSEARPGLRTALNLQGIYKDQLDRGDVVAIPGSLHPSYLLDLSFLYLSSTERPLKYRSPVRFHVGTAEVIGRILFQGEEILPGQHAYIQVKLDEPVAVLPGDHYVIRSYSPIRTIGGGEVLHPLPRKRKRTRPDLWQELEILDKGGPADLISYHLRHAGTRGLNISELAIRTGLYGKTLERELNRAVSSGLVIKLDTDKTALLHGDIYKSLRESLISHLESYHREKPLAPGLSKEELRSKIMSSWSPPKLFQRLLADLVKSGEAVQEKDMVRLAGHRVALGDEDGRIRSEIEKIFRDAGLQPPSQNQVMEKFSSFSGSVREIIDLMVAEGTLVRLKEGLYFHKDAVERARSIVVDFIREHGQMGVSDFRKIAGGISRKYMIPLLEYLDNQRVTIRVGDKRRLRA